MSRPDEMQVSLTGNPFVDTGLAVIAALAGLDDIQALSLATLRDVFGDGRRLSDWNTHLKTFSQVFGTNNPLFQKGYGYHKGKGPGPDNLKIYRETLLAFLDAVQPESKGLACEACGRPTDFDFSGTCTRVVEEAGAKPPEEKWIGRDWFPLSGSLGSDAQALPVASRTARVCATCLFAVHYLPLALISVDGRLAVFQSTSIEFWYELVTDIVKGDGGAESRLSLKHYDTPGTKEGSRAVVRRLLALFERLQKANRLGDITAETPLHVWRFTNSGASPECQIDEIPNPALVFLWKAVREGLRRDVETLIGSEGKQRWALLQCITDRREYSGLYPRGKKAGASPKLFQLYQAEICDRPLRALAVAQSAAQHVSGGLKQKDLARLQRQEAFRSRELRNRLRGFMSDLARQGAFSLDDYLHLFPPAEDENGVDVRFDGWNLVRYYLHHADDSAALKSGAPSPQFPSPKRVKVAYYASCIADLYTTERGTARFQSDVLVRTARDQLGVSWLQKRFTLLASDSPGFTYAAWEALCKNDSGRSCIAELIFQLRLLWAEWVAAGAIPAVTAPEVPTGSGLSTEVDNALVETFKTYVQERGLERLRRDVLERMRREEVGLTWFRRRLVRDQMAKADGVFSMADWEDFLKDEEGHAAPSRRLFQMQLRLANLYREAKENQTPAAVGVKEGPS